METRSSLIYEGDLRHYLKSTPSHLSQIPRVVRDFEGRVETFHFDSTITAEKPLILDLGSGDSPHFFKLFDYYNDQFTYIGVEAYPPKDVSDFLESVKKRHSNFFSIKNSLDDKNLDGIIKELTNRTKVDVIMVEHLAVGSSDNATTDALLATIINVLAPRLLETNGILHLEAASLHQKKEIIMLLEQQKKFSYVLDRDNFTCATNPALLDRLRAENQIKASK